MARPAIELGPRYRPLRRLGRGGLGDVWLVRDTFLRKDLALKLLHRLPVGPEELGEVRREFTLLSRLEHPGLARAHDFSFLGERPCFTAEFIPGAMPGGKRGICEPAGLLRIARDVAEAIAFLHRNEILHLDIKPGNIIVRRDTGRAVLIDFGLCRRGLASTAGEKIKGSLPYMAPEYFEPGPLGPWTDVYALGVTLYRLATGRFPRSSGAPRRTSDRGRRGLPAWDAVPLPPSRLRPGLPGHLDHIILKCLALDPRSRFRSGGELLASLESALPPAPAAGGGDGSRPPALDLATFGREEELRRVEAFIHGLREKGAGMAPALLLTGQPGMGLTHFLREVKLRAQTAGIHAYLETGFSGRSSPPGSLLRCLGPHLAEGEARARWESFQRRLREPRQTLHADTSEAERRLRRASEVAAAVQVLREPVLLIIDDLQFFDEVSLSLVIDLIRFLAGKLPRPPLGIVAGFREGGASVPLVRELAADLLDGGKGEAITLRPLGLKEALALYESRGGEARGAAAARRHPPLAVFERTGGCPRSIVALAMGAVAGARASRVPAGGARSPADLPRHATGVLRTLKLLARPASAAELASLCRLSRRAAVKLLYGIEARGLASRAEAPPGEEEGWLPGPAAESLQGGSPAEKRRLHRRIAAALSAGKAADRMVEAVNHFRRAGDLRAVARHGVPAARYLKSTFQNRAALDLLAAVLAALPRGRRLARLEVALEMADLQVQVGDLDEGIRNLQEFLATLRVLPPAARLRVPLRLATLHGRRGDLERADGLFTEVLGKARAGGSGLSREDLLFFLNEHAMVKGFKGNYSEALALCGEGLDLAGEDAGFRSRELALQLHATRANVALRTFDFVEAAREFQKALKIAEAISSPINQAAVLSNLGLVYSQSDRYDEAIRSYREAERYCVRLDDGPSLVTIYGNLAVLQSKRGEFADMEKALREGERLSPAGIGRRQDLFFRHNQGLCLLNRGRYLEALAHLDASIRLGEEMGDRHVAAFDEVYRAEALIFLGRYPQAAAKLRDLSGSLAGGRVRKMALARLALLGAFTAQPAALEEAAAMHGRLSGERAVPYLDAWDALLLGWAFSIGGNTDQAPARLDPAETFFREHGLRPAHALCLWVKAEALFLRGNIDRAREVLAGSSAAASALLGVLHPLLAARLALAGDDPRQNALAADLLAEAGAGLVGNPLPEWEARLRALRALCGERCGRSRAEADLLRRGAGADVPGDGRGRQIRSAHWKAWTSGGGRSAAARKAAPRAPAAPPVEPGSGKTARLEEGPCPPTREGLVVRSRAMRKLAVLLDRLKEMDLPVLISGETGTGKEMVARIIHRESPRSGGAFLVVDCAAIPAALLDAELFGARAGAFTDLRHDRRGILTLAAGGTVLIDGISEVTLDLQAKLLRVLSEKTVRPLGGEREERLDVRFLFASSRDLAEETREGRFRQDLFYRINVVAVRVPPLRERGEDFRELVQALLAEGPGDPPAVEPEAIERLKDRPWPGNVRELRNVLSRLRLETSRSLDGKALRRVLGEPDTTTTSVFPRRLLDREPLPALHRRLTRDYLLHHFRRLGGDAAALSRFLGVTRRQLYRKLARLGISLAEARRELREGS